MCGVENMQCQAKAKGIGCIDGSLCVVASMLGLSKQEGKKRTEKFDIKVKRSILVLSVSMILLEIIPGLFHLFTQ